MSSTSIPTNPHLHGPSTAMPAIERDIQRSCTNCVHYSMCIIRRSISDLIHRHTELDVYTSDLHMYRGLAESCSSFKNL
jgi:hypothetical protein